MYDLFILGGGINGCGIARDATGRGLNVCLVDKNDIASGTSSYSSKLIHGGLRYLENMEFSLVKEALEERENLNKIVPFLNKPLRFVFPVKKGIRNPLLIRLGLTMYDWLFKSSLKKHSSLSVNSIFVKDFKDKFENVFQYSDVLTDDSRLVVLNAVDAKEKGADILTYTEVLDIKREADYWQIKLQDKLTKAKKTIKAKVFINATGPWVNKVLNKQIKQLPHKILKTIKGSHLILKKFYSHDKAYILQIEDGRIVFVIPYLKDYVIVGTTEVDFKADPAVASCSEQECNYLLGVLNSYFSKKFTKKDVKSSYAGVRPLYGGENHKSKFMAFRKLSRDYSFDVDFKRHKQAPLISIYGGKLTTYRALSEKMLETVAKLKVLDKEIKDSWTAEAPLPGANRNHTTLLRELKKQYKFLKEDYLERLVTSYGTRARCILKDVKTKECLGKEVYKGLFEVEQKYLQDYELARTEEDILKRRTKLELLNQLK